MWIFENVQLAIGSLRANKLRSLLTMLGIIIGIGSVITITTVGDSLSGSIAKEMEGFGASNITLSLRQKNDPFANSSINELSEEEANALFENFEYEEPKAEDFISDEMLEEYQQKFADQLQTVAVSQELGSVSMTNGRHKATGSLYGVNEGQSVIDRITMLGGRFISDTDNNEQRAVAVVSDVFVQQYFGQKATPQQVLGESFETEAAGVPLRLYIAGVYEYKNPNGSKTISPKTGTTIYMPIASANKLLQRTAGYQNVTLQTKEGVENNIFIDRTQQFFESFYTRNPKFEVSASSMEEMVKSMNKMNQTIQLGISGIAGISLLVGGIGVMNIMMVSVTERTREIGIRMALGAKGRVILFQFIVESIIICLIGGLIGVVFGFALGSVAATMMHYPAKPSVIAALIAVLFSMAIGVFFGYYPAKRAAKLDPIEALRYE